MSLSPPPARGADLWLVAGPQPRTRAADLDLDELDDAERSRAGSFRSEADRLLYICTHIALRRLLGGYLDAEPGALRFGRAPCACGDGTHGRPVLDSPESALQFSISHGTGMALIGVSSMPIGVDIEPIPTRRTARVCRRALHPDEQAELRSRSAADGLDADGLDAVRFGQLWTRKEAYLKGIGTGLVRGLSADYLGEEGARHPAEWRIFDVPCGPGHVAAAAVCGQTGRAGPLRVHRLPVDRLFEHGAVPWGKLDTFVAEVVA